MSDALGLGLIFGLVILYLIVLGIGIASYIMRSYAMYQIAKRRSIQNSWLAWIPAGRDWMLGSIADEYDLKNGIKRKWRVAILAMSLITVVGVILIYAVIMVQSIAVMMQYDYYSYIEPPIEEFLGIFVLIYVVMIVLAVINVANEMCKAICIYKLFESTVPEKALKYMLLNLLVPLAGPICLMKCKDAGYPEPYSEPTQPIIHQ